MPGEKYAYAATAVRVREKLLLESNIMERLLTAAGYDAAYGLLSDNGWIDAADSDEDGAATRRLTENWDFLMEASPEPERLHSLVLKNDFHNLKTALRCRFSGENPKKYFIHPCVYSPEEINECVSGGKLDKLPECMRDCAVKAYETFTRTQSGQYIDIITDNAALTAIVSSGKSSACELLHKNAELQAASAGIKTVLRACRTNKTRHDNTFLELSLNSCDTLSRDELLSAAIKGEEAVLGVIEKTAYAGAAAAWRKSASAFEKWFDAEIVTAAVNSKYILFGPEPLAAFYLLLEAEARNIRLLLSGKRHNMEADIIRERMLDIYG